VHNRLCHKNRFWDSLLFFYSDYCARLQQKYDIARFEKADPGLNSLGINTNLFGKLISVQYQTCMIRTQLNQLVKGSQISDVLQLANITLNICVDILAAISEDSASWTQFPVAA